MDYENKWRSANDNSKFWEEVLVGRTIRCLKWHDNGVIKGMVFDNGETLYLNNEEGTRSSIYVEGVPWSEE